MSGNNTKAADLLDNFLLALLDLPGGTWAVSPRRSALLVCEGGKVTCALGYCCFPRHPT